MWARSTIDTHIRYLARQIVEADKYEIDSHALRDDDTTYCKHCGRNRHTPNIYIVIFRTDYGVVYTDDLFCEDCFSRVEQKIMYWNRKDFSVEKLRKALNKFKKVVKKFG